MEEALVPELYSEEKLNDKEMRRLLSVTECEHDKQADEILFDEQRMRQTVSLTLNDGSTVVREMEFPRDKPEYGEVQIEKKFEDLSAGVMDEVKRNKLKQCISGIETLSDINELSACLY